MRAFTATVTCAALLIGLSCSGPEKPGAQTDVDELLHEYRASRQSPPTRPSTDTSPPATRHEPEPGFSSPSRPPQVKGRLDTPLQRDWRHIVIHHSGTDSGSEAIFDRHHREVRGWDGVGYDFVIGNGRGSPDGLVEVTFRWEEQRVGAHAGIKEYNDHGIGICVVGNLDRDHMTPKQMEALVGLVNYLQKRCSIPTSHIYGHRHVRPGGTHCPGQNFPWYEFIARLQH